MKTIYKTILCLSILLGTSACSSYNGKFNAISNRPINLYDITRDATTAAQGIHEESSRSIYIVVSPDDAATLEEVVDYVLTKHKGHYLADVRITRNFFPIVWPYHYNGWVVQGNVMRIY